MIVPKEAREYHVVLGQQLQWVEPSGTDPVRAVSVSPDSGYKAVLRRIGVRRSTGLVYTEFQARRLGSSALVSGLGDNSSQRTVITVDCQLK